MPLIDFIIIGAQKSATTFVQRTLGSHPGICMPRDEITVFRDAISNEDIRLIRKLFAANIQEKVKGIKFPEYLTNENCAKNISSFLPEAKLIAILRNPVDRIFSAYYHYVSAGLAPISDMNKGLYEIIDGRHQEEYPKTRDLIEYGFYYKYLRIYLDYFTRDQILILLYEGIQQNPETSMKKVLAYLGVDNNAELRYPKRRLGKTIYSLPRLRFHIWRNPILFAYDYAKRRVVFKQRFRIARSTIFSATNLFDRLILRYLFKEIKPTMTADLKRTLIDIYKKDICNLEVILGRDLSHWRRVNI